MFLNYAGLLPGLGILPNKGESNGREGGKWGCTSTYTSLYRGLYRASRGTYGYIGLRVEYEGSSSPNLERLGAYRKPHDSVTLTGS